MKKGRSVKAVSIIGGADGPTSIFFASRNGSRKRRIKEQVRGYFYRRRRKKVEAKITAAPHTLDQVCRYIVRAYQAEEVAADERRYQEEYHSLRESLILKHQPELLGEKAKMQNPRVMDEEGLIAFWKEMEERSRLAREIKEGVFPLDFHIYQITLPDQRPPKRKKIFSRKAAYDSSAGNLCVVIEKRYGILSCSYSGDKKSRKALAKISRRIYLCYGVFKEDIEQKTERYQTLVAALSSD